MVPPPVASAWLRSAKRRIRRSYAAEASEWSACEASSPART